MKIPNSRSTQQVTPVTFITEDQKFLCKTTSEDVETLECSSIVGGNVKWCSLSEKPSGCSSESETQKPYGQAIPLLGIHPRKMKT